MESEKEEGGSTKRCPFPSWQLGSMVVVVASEEQWSNARFTKDNR